MKADTIARMAGNILSGLVSRRDMSYASSITTTDVARVNYAVNMAYLVAKKIEKREADREKQTTTVG